LWTGSELIKKKNRMLNAFASTHFTQSLSLGTSTSSSSNPSSNFHESGRHLNNEVDTIADDLSQYISAPALAVLMSLFAGASTALGASAVYCFKSGPLDPSIMSFSLALAAGVMITVSVMELLPRVLEMTPGEGFHEPFIAMVWAFVGIATFLLVSSLLPHCEPHLPYHEHRVKDDHRDIDRVEEEEIDPLYKQKNDEGYTSDEGMSRLRAWRLTLVLMLSLTAHNFPEGLAVAVSTMSNVHLGTIIMIAIMVHNIPEGLVIAVPAYAAHGSKFQAVMLAAASGFSEPLGALVAVFFLKDISETSLRYCLSFVAGMMIAVSLIELIPEALACKRPFHFVGGLIVGVLVMWVTDHLLEE